MPEAVDQAASVEGVGAIALNRRAARRHSSPWRSSGREQGTQRQHCWRDQNQVGGNAQAQQADGAGAAGGTQNRPAAKPCAREDKRERRRGFLADALPATESRRPRHMSSNGASKGSGTRLDNQGNLQLTPYPETVNAWISG